jgi:hypothetical protein
MLQMCLELEVGMERRAMQQGTAAAMRGVIRYFDSIQVILMFQKLVCNLS